MFKDSTISQINEALQNSNAAFRVYSTLSLKQRAQLMYDIAAEIEALGDELLQVAGRETNLPEARLRNERARTMFQLTSYADACVQGDWLEARIDTAIPDKNPPKPDIRKMLVPLGPVVVFGAANFPFAYSTAGGDTASALAAGCTVILKVHPAHPGTSELMAKAIHQAVAKNHLPAGVFIHLHGASNETGEALVKHPLTKAVGFTGSLTGGRQLFDWACQRPEPIPVFAEMSSINPVFLLPGKLKEAPTETAKQYAGSITLGVGQFCTNPGLLIGLQDENLDAFTHALASEISQAAPGTMLHAGIQKNYTAKKAEALAQPEVQLVAEATATASDMQATAAIASVSGADFLQNPLLHREVFGPYSLLIRCKDAAEMQAVAEHLEGQLTCTLMATAEDLKANPDLVQTVKMKCGRFILNGVPTGVEVCLSMQHGGPYPATTDSRFGAVGADAIKRFARPLAFQNWPDEMLPDELKAANPLGIWRTVNNEWMK